MTRPLITFAIAALVSVAVDASAKPCTCKEELAGLRAANKDRKAQRVAWLKVVTDCLPLASNTKKPPKDMAEAKARFVEYMGWSSAREVGGVSPLGEAKVDPKFVAETCDVVVKGTNDVHEGAHTSYYWSHAFSAIMASEEGLAELLAMSEVDARTEQIKFFVEEIAKRKKQCGRDLSSDDPSSPGSGAGSANTAPP